MKQPEERSIQPPTTASGHSKATIREVAARAGVSKSLVSLVLQDSPLVRPAKRDAVLAAIAELGYQPSAAARALSTGNSGTIGLLVDDLANPWFVDLARGLRDGLHDEHLRMIVGDPHFFTFPGESRIGPFLQLRVDALVVAGHVSDTDLLEQAARTIPTVVLGSPSPSMVHADLVVNDDRLGARLAVQHLAELGHRRIAHLVGTGEAASRRLDGYRQAMVEMSLESHIQLTPAAEMTEAGGAWAAQSLLEPSDRPTALFAANDMMAIGALNIADSLGIAVPRQLSIVGYDDTPTAAIGRISLTTIDNVSHEIGLRGAQLLRDRLQGSDGAPVTEILEPRLVVRRTTATVPANS